MLFRSSRKGMLRAHVQLRLHTPRCCTREELRLLVKTSEPPCIGLFNGDIFSNPDSIERYRCKDGTPAPEPWTGVGRPMIFPGDWLTILANTGRDLTAESAVMTLEALMVDGHFDVTAYPGEPRSGNFVRTYHVVGVCFSCLQSDPCIGAELIKEQEEACDALLL